MASSGSPTSGSGPQAGATENLTRSRGDSHQRGRGRGRSRNQYNSSRGGRTPQNRARGQRRVGDAASAAQTGSRTGTNAAQDTNTTTDPKIKASMDRVAGGGADEDVEAEVCFICASPVIHQSLAPCNHSVCHICALRMRALYKNKECAHCRTAAQYVIFTDDAIKRFEDYTEGPPDITSTDDNIGIRYTSEDIVGDTVLLLRYNCPDESCDFAGLGWPDLHRHVRSVHHKKMCDLCTRNKKVFTHEHELFTDKELERHMRHGDDRPGAVDQTGFKGHPLCAFCGQRFYDDDKLYEHCRERHERCFLCDREDPRHPHYYVDYNSLEQHFRKDHYLCPDSECQEKKFVVFASEMDLKAHQLSEHGNALSKDVRRDARLVDMAAFDFRQPYQEERRPGGGRGRDRERRGRGRDPNAEPIPASSAQPLRRDELAFQRQMAIQTSQSANNRTFGGQLSSSTSTPTPSSSTVGAQTRNTTAASDESSSLGPAVEGLRLADPNLTPQERARLVRHAAVIERASNLLQNDGNKIANFRELVSDYQQNKIIASTVVDAFFTLFGDTSSTAIGTLVRELADLFEDKTKAQRLLEAWNNWRAINEDYPTLPGLSGMHGATTSSSGWAAAASNSPTATTRIAPSQRHTTRVLKLKSSTQQSQRSTAGQPSSWATASGSTRSAPAPSSFPALPSNSRRPTGGSTSLWGPGGSSQSSSRTTSRPGNRDENFPALPSAPKPQTTIFGYGTGAVRRDLGGSRNTGFSWGGSSIPNAAAEQGSAQDAESNGTGTGKKKGKGRKQVLVQWG